MTRQGETAARAARSLKALVQRFAYFGLVAAAVALMLIGKIETVLVEEARARAVDVAAPVLDVLSRPVETMVHFVLHVRELTALREENARLRAENARLVEWQVVARRLDGENQALRELLRFDPDQGVAFVSARAIADAGGGFVRTVLINAGARDGVDRRQAVISGEGLVGRVSQVGHRSARVLLITDLNSKIPVVVGDARLRAIVVGDNSDRPQLRYLDGDAGVFAGDLVLTSGHGGVFPPGIPVGVVTGERGAAAYVRPFVDWHRLEYVRVVDYGGAGIADGGLE